MECSLCRDTGWLLETRDRMGIVTMEILPCLIPDCKKSGQRVELLSLHFMNFGSRTKHPIDGYIMSVSRIK